MSHQGKSVYVPTYARSVYGLTKCYFVHMCDRTHKLQQTLDLDSQRITQSSQAIQSALESITTLFHSTNLH